MFPAGNRARPPSFGDWWRVLLNLTLVSLLIAGGGACKQRTPDGGGRSEIVFKHSKIFGNPAALDKILADFEKQQGGAVVVRNEEIPASAGEQHQLYVINLEGHSTAFDVLGIDIIWVAEFARAGWVLPLDDVLEPNADDLYFSATLTASRYRGRPYGMPWFIDAGLLYYRKDLLQKHGFEPPRTWAELVRQAKEIAAAEKIYGFVWEGKQSEGLLCNALEFLWGNGGDVLADGQVVLDSEQNIQAFQFLHDLIFKHRVTPRIVSNLTEEGARQLFTAGKAVFIRNWPYMWNTLQREDSPLRGRVGISPLPSFPGHEPVSTLGGWYLAVNRYSTNPEGAKALIRYLSLPEVQKELARTAGFQPPRKALYQDADLLQLQPSLRELALVFEKARPRPVTPFYLQISEILQPEVSSVVVGTRSPAEALHAAAKRLRFVLQDIEAYQ